MPRMRALDLTPQTRKPPALGVRLQAGSSLMAGSIKMGTHFLHLCGLVLPGGAYFVLGVKQQVLRWGGPEQ